MNTHVVEGNLVDISGKRMYAARLEINQHTIQRITPLSQEVRSDFPFIVPGFIDAHVHIESSMLVPSEFARLAVVHGTVATVSDPHEIANVCGYEGVSYMIENGKQVPFKFFFGAPSCVPATIFETAGAELPVGEVTRLLDLPEIFYLSEMMNYPGVICNDPQVMAKLEAAKRMGKPVDGHAPGLRGPQLEKYAAAGISTDHECFTLEEAQEKLQLGMKVIIREGSAARNFDALIPLLHQWEEQVMFCSDDKHPDSLVLGHINQLCRRAVKAGIDVFKVLKAACVNPVLHYKLPVGLLKPGDPADFLLLKNLEDFEVVETWINGLCVASQGKTLISSIPAGIINRFEARPLSPALLSYPLDKWGEEENIEQAYAIEALDGQLITNKLLLPLSQFTFGHPWLESSVENDLLKIVVVNRYHEAPIAKSFVKNFGLKMGAMASSIAHDSHNIVAVGVDDESLCKAVNLVIEAKGGIAAVSPVESHCLPLPIAGLMSGDDGYVVAQKYETIDQFTKNTLGSPLRAPFMTLSFMALLVIPHLKLSDKGLFDGDAFALL